MEKPPVPLHFSKTPENKTWVFTFLTATGAIFLPLCTPYHYVPDTGLLHCRVLQMAHLPTPNWLENTLIKVMRIIDV